MAQLVKLQDYISRYQIDMNRYPAQFVRMKKSGWERIKSEWESGELVQKWEHMNDSVSEEVEMKKQRFSLIKKLFKRNQQNGEAVEQVDEIQTEGTLGEESLPDDETTLLFEPNIVYNPQSIDELKKIFIDQFFHFQIKWASSTLREKSFVNSKFIGDSFLRTVLQTLPDNYLVLYYPIVKLKKAPIELDVVILTPLECLCITIVERENYAVYTGSSEREHFWVKKVGESDTKILNPIIQLNRMETIVSQLFTQNNVTMPIRKILLSRNGYFDYPGTIYNLQFIDKRNYENWIDELKHLASPMKHMQIQAAKTLLSNVETTSYNRML
ncbi:NERD domain-containing protein [Ureibacillus acetophenoni]|uniref:Nuclease-like protein n=1 Tax=Ureibacillus acetophenoni TaxID=614649 RepID=A0A285U8L7_9BACL|nr:NERD domain-containing protein [Ureibacillus acetophenoni]SOC36631.1 nuclease-like protein [Ureibacillus acetophenoni]